jgi:hypothetical protein
MINDDMLEAKKKKKKTTPLPPEAEDDGPPTGPDGKPLKPRPMAKGGTASSRADGCAVKGKTRGKMM